MEKHDNIDRLINEGVELMKAYWRRGFIVGVFVGAVGMGVVVLVFGGGS